MPGRPPCRPILMGLASRLASDLNSPKSGAHVAGADLGHLDRLEAGLDERPRHLGGQRLGPLIRPDEVVADGGGDRVLQLAPISAQWCDGSHPSITFSMCWRDHPEPTAQVVVDIRCQVSDPVVEHLLPQRGLLQRLLRLLLAPLEVLGQPLPGIRIVERGQLRLHGHASNALPPNVPRRHLVAHPVVLP